MTLDAIMVQLQRMNALLDTLSDELCQVNTHVDRITRWLARLGGFVESPSPSPEASRSMMMTPMMRCLLDTLTLCHS